VLLSADDMRAACRGLADATVPMPLVRSVPVGKLVRLLRAKQVLYLSI